MANAAHQALITAKIQLRARHSTRGRGAAVTDGYPTGRHARGGAIPWLFAGALIIVAVFGIAFAVLLTGNGTQPRSGHHRQQQLAAGSPAAATTPAQSASPAGSASHTPKPTHKSSASTAPSATPQPHSPNPTQQQNATVRLTATVSADSWNHSQDGGRVTFQVDDTGSAATGQITATITLPAGASMGGGGGGNEATVRSLDGNSGWNCQATSTGGICTHAGLAAGGTAWGAISFTLSGNSVCGQLVELTAASGSASSSAQSKVAC